jgi:hypothetical protein
MHKNATKCNETLSKWCKNKHGASKIMDTLETYHTLRLVNNVDMIETPLQSIIISGIWKSRTTPTYSTMNLVIVCTINVVVISFCLAIYYLSEIRFIWYQPYLVRSRSRQALFTHSVIWHSRDLVTCLQVISMWYHREGPRGYLSVIWMDKSHSWASTNTFKAPKSTFIITLLWCDIWYHQINLLALVIDMILWSTD